MQNLSLHNWLIAAATAVAGIGCALPATAPAADYIDLRRIQPVRDGDAEAGERKAQTCVACHGANGVAPVANFPNLYGQTVEYLYWALVDFKRGTRPASPMTPLVAPLDDQDMRDLAAFYGQADAVDTPAAAPAEPEEELLARGEQLYLQGDASSGIPPCQGCHGAEGRGHPMVTGSGAEARTEMQGHTAWRTYPALRAQNEPYLVSTLTAYRDGELDDSTNDFIMKAVARNLDDASIRAISAWLSSQRWAD